MSQLTIDLHLRPVVEFRHGYRNLVPEDTQLEVLSTLQTRLSGHFNRNGFTTKVTLQDARVWGRNDGLFGLYEAWLEYRFHPAHRIRLGRQQLHYLEGRLISRRPWRQDGYFYDALVYQFNRDSTRIDIASAIDLTDPARRQEDSRFRPGRFKIFNYVFARKDFSPGLSVAVYLIAAGAESNLNKRLYVSGTYGTQVHYQKGRYRMRLEGYFQNGAGRDGRKTRGYLYAGHFQWILKKNKAIGVGVESFSGNDLTSDTDFSRESHVFDHLEGARFRYFGRMNLFRNYDRHTGGGGLYDLYLSAQLEFGQRVDAVLKLHYFLTNQKLQDPDMAGQFLERSIGPELDIMADFTLNDHLELRLGCAVILPTSTLEYLQGLAPNGSGFQYFGWAMLTSDLNLFTSK